MLSHSQAVKLNPDAMKKIDKLRADHREKIKKEVATGNISTEIKTLGDGTAVPATNKTRKATAGKPRKGNKKTDVEGDANTNGFDELLEAQYREAENNTGNADVDGASSYGGALWDIFRREDVPKLKEYLNKHVAEFRHFNGKPIECVSVLLLLI